MNELFLFEEGAKRMQLTVAAWLTFKGHPDLAAQVLSFKGHPELATQVLSMTPEFQAFKASQTIKDE